MVMETVNGYRYPKNRKPLRNSSIALNSNALLVIQLPDSRGLRVVSHSMLLAMVIFTFPCIGSIFRGAYLHDSVDYLHDSTRVMDLEFFDLLWEDLCEMGFIEKGHKALIVTSSGEGPMGRFELSNDNEIDVVIESDLQKQESFPYGSFDFAYLSGSVDLKYVDPVMKIGGIVAMQFNEHQNYSNYSTLYVRRFSSMIVAMRKNGPMDRTLPADSLKKQGLCQSSLEAKKAVLKGLEDALLEPPRRGSTESINHLKELHFLPDLSGDSLGNYPRRVFIDAGSLDLEERNDMMKWFEENYPKRDQEFEVYGLEMVPEEGDSRVGISDWLAQNVVEEDYVVMKAEAEAVEEMTKQGTICLIDELILECNNHRQEEQNKKKGKRAYWECLSLYGRLKDEGVAVHQWWGL